MKRYHKLRVPKDSAWDRKSWRRFLHWRIRDFIHGVKNIIRWIPVLYKDRDWDHFYIAQILQKKLEHQREELIKANRFVGVEDVNKDLTLALNLLERLKLESYSIEYADYKNLSEYLHKYRLTAKKVIKKYNLDPSDKRRVAYKVATYTQEKCDRIFWKLMFYKFPQWWD